MSGDPWPAMQAAFEEREANKKTLRTAYTLAFATDTFRAGKHNEFESPIPVPGLVATVACSGFGSGQSRSYVVLSTATNRNGQVVKAEVAPIVRFDDKMLEYDAHERRRLVQSYDSEGFWKWEGDKAPSLYFVRWGEIGMPDIGFEK